MKPKRTWILIVFSAMLVGIVFIAVGKNMLSIMNGFIRSMALLGYLAVFITSLLSMYMRQMIRIFGRPFQTIHHYFSIGGLTLLFLHGAAVAWDIRSLGAFLPSFKSFYDFFSLAGRPALWLFALTTLTAFLRKAFRKQWRQIHLLNYIAFILGSVHGILIGTDFESLVVKILSVLMSLALVVAFTWKRMDRRRKTK